MYRKLRALTSNFSRFLPARRTAERLALAEKDGEEKRTTLGELLAEMTALEEERDRAVERAHALAALDEERQALLDLVDRSIAGLASGFDDPVLGGVAPRLEATASQRCEIPDVPGTAWMLSAFGEHLTGEEIAIALSRLGIEEVQARSHEVAELLLKSGADVNCRQTDVPEGFPEYVKQPGISLVHTSEQPKRQFGLVPGMTPLHLAAVAKANADMVQFLLENGADANVRDSSGRTALDWARQYKESRTAKVLENAG